MKYLNQFNNKLGTKEILNNHLYNFFNINYDILNFNITNKTLNNDLNNYLKTINLDSNFHLQDKLNDICNKYLDNIETIEITPDNQKILLSILDTPNTKTYQFNRNYYNANYIYGNINLYNMFNYQNIINNKSNFINIIFISCYN